VTAPTTVCPSWCVREHAPGGDDPNDLVLFHGSKRYGAGSDALMLEVVCATGLDGAVLDEPTILVDGGAREWSLVDAEWVTRLLLDAVSTARGRR
jgi:hypothetical protein